MVLCTSDNGEKQSDKGMTRKEEEDTISKRKGLGDMRKKTQGINAPQWHLRTYLDLAISDAVALARREVLSHDGVDHPRGDVGAGAAAGSCLEVGVWAHRDDGRVGRHEGEEKLTRVRGETTGAKLFTLEVGAAAPRGTIRVPEECACVTARDRECSTRGDDVERRIGHEWVRREGHRHFEVVVASGAAVVRGVRNGFVATAEEQDLDRWAREKWKGQSAPHKQKEKRRAQILPDWPLIYLAARVSTLKASKLSVRELFRVDGEWAVTPLKGGINERR
jgi:hypothetical protein